MTKKPTIHISIGLNECVYNGKRSVYQVEKYVYGLKSTDHISYDTSDYIYSIKIHNVDCNLMEYRKLIIELPVKPTKNIRLKLMING